MSDTSPWFTRSAFRRWWLSQPPKQALGFIKQCFSCPLATYLNTVRQEEGCWVGERTWYAGNDRRHVLPQWAQRFVARLDTGMGARFTVDVAAALTVLEET